MSHHQCAPRDALEPRDKTTAPTLTAATSQAEVTVKLSSWNAAERTRRPENRWAARRRGGAASYATHLVLSKTIWPLSKDRVGMSSCGTPMMWDASGAHVAAQKSGHSSAPLSTKPGSLNSGVGSATGTWSASSMRTSLNDDSSTTIAFMKNAPCTTRAPGSSSSTATEHPEPLHQGSWTERSFEGVGLDSPRHS